MDHFPCIWAKHRDAYHPATRSLLHHFDDAACIADRSSSRNHRKRENTTPTGHPRGPCLLIGESHHRYLGISEDDAWDHAMIHLAERLSRERVVSGNRAIVRAHRGSHLTLDFPS